PLGEGLRGVGGGRALLEHILGVGDALARRADGRDLGREDLIPVQEHLDPVAGHHRVTGVRDEGGAEGGLSHLERGQLQMGLDVAAPPAGQRQCQKRAGGDRGSAAHSRRSCSMRSSVAGCVLRKPPPPSDPPDEFISQVRVLIMRSLFRPTRCKSSTPWRSAAYSSLRLYLLWMRAPATGTTRPAPGMI